MQTEYKNDILLELTPAVSNKARESENIITEKRKEKNENTVEKKEKNQGRFIPQLKFRVLSADHKQGNNATTRKKTRIPAKIKIKKTYKKNE